MKLNSKISDNILVPRKTQVKEIAKVLSRAFFNYPTFVVSIPNEEKRKRNLHVLFESMVKYCMKYGEIFVTSEELEGVMLCLTPELPKISSWKMIKCGAIKIPFKLGFNFVQKQEHMDKIMEEMRKTHAPFPHTYLWVIAVDPSFQNQKFSSKLIQYLLKNLNEKNLSCYLETVKSENVDIYKHFGFVLKEARIIPEINITTYSMLWKK